MFEEPFAQGSSPLHRVDPRVRLALAGLGACCLALLRTLPAAGTACLLGALTLACSFPPLRPLTRRMLVVNAFIMFLWCTVAWSVPGTPFFSLWGLQITQEGVELCLLVTLKANGILWLFLALVATMHSATAGHALEQLGMPSKLVFLLLFTYRHIHVIAAEWERLRVAARLRGFKARTSMHTYRTVAHMLGMVLVRSYERARHVYEAMLLRGFHGRFFSIIRFSTRWQDVAFTIIMTCAYALILLLDSYGGCLV